MPDVHQSAIGEVRIVALSRISPGPEFNPRTARDPERHRARAGRGRRRGGRRPLEHRRAPAAQAARGRRAGRAGRRGRV